MTSANFNSSSSQKTSSAKTYDAVLVGSGINSLVAAALLARAGRSVLVLEREAVLGGCIRTDALTLPGFLHDTLSTAHPLFVLGPAYKILGAALHAAGLEYCNNDTPTGVLLPDGSFQILSTSRQRNVENFERTAKGDGDAYNAAMEEIQNNAALIFSLLGTQLWHIDMAKTLGKAAWGRGVHGLGEFFGAALTSCRHWLDSEIKDERLKGLLAPWTLHTGLGPDSSASALMAKVVAFSLEAVGIPQVKGGNYNTVRAFEKVIKDAGGELWTNADVQKIVVEGGKARGVSLRDGREVRAKEVICNVTPTQLYGNLLPAGVVPQKTTKQAKAFRYGKGDMQIHLALSEAPKWSAPELANVTYLHLSGGADAVSKAVNEAERGMLPASPTICVNQPSAIDPSRAPAGQAVLWIQLPECPRILKGDASGVIQTPADGKWDEATREAYADRIIEQISAHLPNLKSTILMRKVLSPADLEAMNVNLVGGDPYGGACDLDQSFLWRPLGSTKNHSTPVPHLWHIGASTHPGPGLGGGSGFLVAQQLKAI